MGNGMMSVFLTAAAYGAYTKWAFLPPLIKPTKYSIPEGNLLNKSNFKF